MLLHFPSSGSRRTVAPRLASRKAESPSAPARFSEGVIEGTHMGKKRLRKNDDLPDNLYPNGNRFTYRHPISKERFSLGSDREYAIDNATRINSELALARHGKLAYADKILMAPAVQTEPGAAPPNKKTIADLIDSFNEEDVPNKDWSKKTAYNKTVKLEKFRSLVGTKRVFNFSVQDANEFLKAATASPRNRQQYRELGMQLFRRAGNNGWVRDGSANVFEATIVYGQERQRIRLTTESFTAIRAVAPYWLQNAMDAALYTLLRRSDIVGLRMKDMAEETGRDNVKMSVLYVIPQKTEGTTGVKMRMRLRPEALEVFKRCRDNVLSPFVIHRQPERRKAQDQRAEAREHHTQVLPEQLTKAFRKARDLAVALDGKPFFAGMGDDETLPTFHEVRSLGIARYYRMGLSKPQIQLIAGHASIEMTEHYLEGHDLPWVDVDVGMEMAGMTEAGA